MKGDVGRVIKKLEEYLVKVEVQEPGVLAGEYKKLFNYRIFRRGNETTYLIKDFKNEEEYEKNKKKLIKEGFVPMDYTFPRYMNNPLKINWHAYLVHPIYLKLKKEFKISNLKIVKIYPALDEKGREKVWIGYDGKFYKGEPVYYERLEPGSEFHVIILTPNHLEVGSSKLVQIGRGRARGYGWVRIKIEEKLSGDVS